MDIERVTCNEKPLSDHYHIYDLCPTDLFPTVRGQVKGEDRQKGYSHAGDDQVDGVEQSFAPHCNIKCYV